MKISSFFTFKNWHPDFGLCQPPIKIDVFTPTLTKRWCGKPANGEPRQCLLLCCVKIYSPSLWKRTDGNIVKGDVYLWRKWVDFLRGSACAVVTRNFECSPDVGEARGTTSTPWRQSGTLTLSPGTVQKLVSSITMKTIVGLLLLSLVCLLRLWLKIELQLLPCSRFNRIRLPSW
jgi:hypothetical protein